VIAILNPLLKRDMEASISSNEWINLAVKPSVLDGLTRWEQLEGFVHNLAKNGRSVNAEHGSVSIHETVSERRPFSLA
jgi:hypothetical protein